MSLFGRLKNKMRNLIVKPISEKISEGIDKLSDKVGLSSRRSSIKSLEDEPFSDVELERAAPKGMARPKITYSARVSSFAPRSPTPPKPVKP